KVEVVVLATDQFFMRHEGLLRRTANRRLRPMKAKFKGTHSSVWFDCLLDEGSGLSTYENQGGKVYPFPLMKGERPGLARPERALEQVAVIGLQLIEVQTANKAGEAHPGA